MVERDRFLHVPVQDTEYGGTQPMTASTQTMATTLALTPAPSRRAAGRPRYNALEGSLRLIYRAGQCVRGGFGCPARTA